MKKYSPWIGLALLVGAIILIPGCASTKLVDVWKDPALQAPVNHVLVIALRKEPVRRRIWEDAFVTRLTQHNVNAVSSYTLFPDEIPDTNEVRDIVTTENFDAILMAHALPKEISTQNVPESYTYEPVTRFNPWRWRYYTYWEEVLHPAYVDTTSIFRYQMDLLKPTSERGQLIWSGTITTTDPSTVEGLQREVANQVVNTLSKQGVIPPSQK